jgi:hypothetical protein
MLFSKIFLENCFLWSRYGAGTETITSQKIGTGTVKNSYGYATLPLPPVRSLNITKQM